MSAEDIRSEAVELAAAAIARDAGEATSTRHRIVARKVVDALTGLLPTRVEYRDLEDGHVGQTVTAEGNVTTFSKPSTRQQRYVTDWRTTKTIE